MSLYVESSAVLAWLLDEENAAFVRHSLAATSIVMASDLTLIGGSAKTLVSVAPPA